MASDFEPVTGGVITIVKTGLGEGAFGAGPFGGVVTIVVNPVPNWTPMAETEDEIEETDTDFIPIGDSGVVIETVGEWGDSPYGDEPWGGQQNTAILNANTLWTFIDQP